LRLCIPMLPTPRPSALGLWRAISLQGVNLVYPEPHKTKIPSCWRSWSVISHAHLSLSLGLQMHYRTLKYRIESLEGIQNCRIANPSLDFIFEPIYWTRSSWCVSRVSPHVQPMGSFRPMLWCPRHDSTETTDCSS
jgi:hypothetical protein